MHIRIERAQHFWPDALPCPELHEPSTIQQHTGLHISSSLILEVRERKLFCMFFISFPSGTQVRAISNQDHFIYFFNSDFIKQDIYCVHLKEGAGIATSRAVTMFCLP